MKGRLFHYALDFVARDGSLGRYCCKASSVTAAICNACANSSSFPFHIVKIYKLENYEYLRKLQSKKSV